MMDFKVIIPARMESTRFPGKVLADIHGEPMIKHVYRRAVESGAESVVIATDSKQVKSVAESFGAKVCMTEASHASGTERIAEAVVTLGYDEDDILVNVQADEPLIPPEIILKVAEDLEEHDNVKVTSLCDPIESIEELLSPDVVKVVLNRRGYAMYFSRAVIPWEREAFRDKNNLKITGNHYRHVGIYAFRVGFLQDYVSWTSCPLEHMESLEQLRILWHGGRIHVSTLKKRLPPDVNTPEDLEKIIAYLSGQKKSSG